MTARRWRLSPVLYRAAGPCSRCPSPPSGPTKTIVTPEARRQHFGQWDHVRLCGLDYADRIRAAGFVVEVLPTDVVTEAECVQMRIQTDRYIFYCRKAM